MKQSYLHLIIILASLITVILIASIFLIFTMRSNTPNTPDEDDSVAVGVTTAEKTKAPGSTTSGSPSNQTTTTTNPPVTPESPTPPPVTPPPTTTKPSVTTKPPVTTTPPTVTPPDTTQPGLNSPSGVIAGDSLGSLGIFASYQTEESDPASNTLKVRFTFYVESYSLQIGARTDNYLIVNGKRISKLESPKISLPSGTPQTRTVLYEYVCEIEKPDDNTPVSLAVEYNWHFQGSYSGSHAEWMAVAVNMTL